MHKTESSKSRRRFLANTSLGLLSTTLAPWSNWEAAPPRAEEGPKLNRFVRIRLGPGPVPGRDEDIAFAPLTQLSLWIEQRQLTSERLTNIYLERLNRFKS